MLRLWHYLSDVAAARCFPHEARKLPERLRNRADLEAAASARKSFPRLDNPLDRVCYLCDRRLPETMYHLYLHCECAELVTLRTRVRQELRELVELSERIGRGPSTRPDLDGDVELFSLLMLCDGVGVLDHLCPVVVASESGLDSAPSALRVHAPVAGVLSQGRLLLDGDVLQAAELARRNGTILLREADMRVVANWVSFFTNALRTRIMSGFSSHPDDASIGERLVRTVVSHCQRVFSVRRRLLSTSVDFLRRSRDPPRPRRAAGTAGAAGAVAAPVERHAQPIIRAVASGDQAQHVPEPEPDSDWDESELGDDDVPAS